MHLLVHDKADTVGIGIVEDMKLGKELTRWIMETDETIKLKAADPVLLGHKIALDKKVVTMTCSLARKWPCTEFMSYSRETRRERHHLGARLLSHGRQSHRQGRSAGRHVPERMKGAAAEAKSL